MGSGPEQRVHRQHHLGELGLQAVELLRVARALGLGEVDALHVLHQQVAVGIFQ
jgi:hypothetical protein